MSAFGSKADIQLPPITDFIGGFSHANYLTNCTESIPAIEAPGCVPALEKLMLPMPNVPISETVFVIGFA